MKQVGAALAFLAAVAYGEESPYIFRGAGGPITFGQAQQACQALGTNLASIHCEAENKVAAKTCRDRGLNCWIGANDRQNEAHGNKWGFVWVDGTQMDYQKFRLNEPNDPDGTEDCVHLTGDWGHQWALWNDVDCHSEWNTAYLCNNPNYTQGAICPDIDTSRLVAMPAPTMNCPSDCDDIRAGRAISRDEILSVTYDAGRDETTVMWNINYEARLRGNFTDKCVNSKIAVTVLGTVADSIAPTPEPTNAPTTEPTAEPTTTTTNAVIPTPQPTCGNVFSSFPHTPGCSDTAFQPNGSPIEGSTCQATCSNLLTTASVWGYSSAKGVNISAYTGGDMPWIGCVGNGCGSSSFYCNDATDFLEFGTTSSSAMRSLLYNQGNTWPTSFSGCCSCSSPSSICNSPADPVSVDVLCQQLGYDRGEVDGICDNYCPEPHYNGVGWTSDYKGSYGWGQAIRCYGAGSACA